MSRFIVLCDDMRAALAAMDPESVDAVVTDPPYELSNDGKASPIRVALEVMFPKDADVEVEVAGADDLAFLVREVARLHGVRRVPGPTPAMPERPVTLDDDPAQRDHDVEHGDEPTAGPAQTDARGDGEAEPTKHLGCFALKAGDAAALFDALYRSGACLLAGGLGVGLRLSAAGFEGLGARLRAGLGGDDRNAIVGAFHDALAIGECAGRTAEHSAVARVPFAREVDAQILSTSAALALLSTLFAGGAQAVRARARAGRASTMLQPVRFHVVGDAADGALSFDLLLHESTIATSGFMGKAWDGSKVAFDVETWRACLRVLKPGGHLLAFGATRTSHRIACAIEDAGFEIRDTLAWLFGSGFPKSLDVSKAIDRAAGATRKVVGQGGSNCPGIRAGGPCLCAENKILGGTVHAPETAPATPDAARWSGWGTALKPAMEPVIVARKPVVGTIAANVLRHGTGAINVDGCRIGTEAIAAHGGGVAGDRTYGAGKGIPAIAAGSNPHLGRWPANVIMDAEAGRSLDAMAPQTGASIGAGETTKTYVPHRQILGADNRAATVFGHDARGGASRFFYSPKADGGERDAGLDALPVATRRELIGDSADNLGINSPRAGAGRTSEGRRNTHATVKPIDLMRYLCRLVTPPGGVVLDPFTGSGTTGVGALLEGFRFIGVEMQTDHACIAWHRLAHWEKRQLAPGADARSGAEKPKTGAANLDLFSGGG